MVIHLAAIGLLFAERKPDQTPSPLDYVAVTALPLQALGKLDAAPKRPTPIKPIPQNAAPEAPRPPQPIKPNSPVVQRPDPIKPTNTPSGKPTPDRPASESPTQREDPEEETDGPTGSAQGSQAGTSAFGTHRVEGIDPDFTYDYYLDRMLALIHRQWSKPNTQADVRAVIRFTVLKSGEIEAVDLAETSGSNAFDLAALRAVNNASPLPRLPASYRRSALEVTLIVRSEPQ